MTKYSSWTFDVLCSLVLLSVYIHGTVQMQIHTGKGSLQYKADVQASSDAKKDLRGRPGNPWSSLNIKTYKTKSGTRNMRQDISALPRKGVQKANKRPAMNENSKNLIEEHTCTRQFHCPNETYCNCSSLHLRSVPQTLPTSLEKLNLFGNLIEDLYGGAFARYPMLIELCLEDNDIHLLKNGSFLELKHLRVLNLRTNFLKLSYTSYPKGTFTPLVSLTFLDISRNHRYTNGTFQYPDQTLIYLTNLIELHMDGLFKPIFGSGFASLASLRILSLVGYQDGFCGMKGLLSETFSNLFMIEKLNLSDCNLIGNQINTETFRPLKNLKSLDLMYNHMIGLDYIASILMPLRDNTHLHELMMPAIQDRYANAKVFTNQMAASLPRSLETLVAWGNNINNVEGEVISKMPKNLTTLVLGGNLLYYGNYLTNFSLMRNLKTLDMTSHHVIYRLPTSKPNKRRRRRDLASYRHKNIHNNLLTPEGPLKLPPNLHTLHMDNADLHLFLTAFYAEANNSLEVVTMNENVFPSAEGPFHNFDLLKTLSLRNCKIEVVWKQFLKSFPALEYLDLSQNYLGRHKHFSCPLEGLGNLKVLNLSLNFISHLDKHVFDDLEQLEVLDLQGNSIWDFTIDISNLKQLRLLDLSFTNAHFLPPDVRAQVDQTTDRLKINMSNTPIWCECSNLDFLLWLSTSKAFPVNLVQYKCVFNSERKDQNITDRYRFTISNLQRTCHSFTQVMISCLIVFFVFLICTLGFTIYHFRWRMRYMIHSLNVGSRQKHFEYDVFLSYNAIDEEFVMDIVDSELTSRGLKTYIHGKHFKAGNFIASNIVKAVRICNKTLVVMSSKWVASPWCLYEMKMATVESIHRGSPVLAFLIVERMKKKNLACELLDHLETNTYTEYPGRYNPDVVPRPDPRLSSFWDKLVDDLRRTEA